MDLISVRKSTNKIHFDFYYNCPNTGKRKRNRKATGLTDCRTNRVKAQQMAMDFLNALSHQPIATPNQPNAVQPVQSVQPIQLTQTPQVIQQLATTPLQAIQPVEQPKPVHTLQDIFNRYKMDILWLKLEPTTQELYNKYFENHLQPHFTCFNFADLTMSELQGFRIHLAEKKMPNSKRKYGGKYLNEILALLLMLCRFAMDENLMPEFNLSRRKLPKFKEERPQVNALTPAERDTFLEYIREHDSYYLPVVTFAAYTGCRVGEIKALKWRDVNLQADSVHVRQSMTQDGVIKSTKTAKTRTVYLHPKVVEVLQPLWSKQRSLDNFVFVGLDGQHFKKNRLTKVVSRNAKAAGLKHITMHSLRHTCGSAIANQHGILRASQALGHSQITTTMQYYHEDADALKAAMTKQ